MYGTSPPGIEKDLSTFCSYYCTVIPLRRNEKTGEPIRATNPELVRRIKELLAKFAMVMVMFSLLLPSDYAPFPSPRKDESFIPLTTMFHWGHLLNNLATACE